MMYVIPQTRDEKIAMYMKLTKREIAEMLVNSSEALDNALAGYRAGVSQSPENWTASPPSGTTWQSEPISIGTRHVQG